MKRILTYVVLCTAIMASTDDARAQEFPMPPAFPAENGGIWTVPADDAMPPDALDALIAVQQGMYDVIAAFDERATLFEKYVGEIEREQIHAKIEEITQTKDNSDKKKPKLTKKEQERLDAVVTEPTLCADVYAALNRYIDEHTAELESAVATLLKDVETMDDAQKTEAAMRLSGAFGAMRSKKRAQEIIAWCVYKNNNEIGQPCEYSVEKLMKKWFRIQDPLLDAWLGETD